MVDVNTNPLYYAAVGGVILGIATSLNYCLRGKVTGMSGIIFGLTSCKLGNAGNIKMNSLRNCRLLEECWSLQASSLTSLAMEPITILLLLAQNTSSLHTHPILVMLWPDSLLDSGQN